MSNLKRPIYIPVLDIADCVHYCSSSIHSHTSFARGEQPTEEGLVLYCKVQSSCFTGEKCTYYACAS